MKTYTRLSFSDREETSKGLAAGRTFIHIAHNIGRPVSTVSDEVWSNCTYRRNYRAEKAQSRATNIRHRQKQSKKLESNTTLRDSVVEKLTKRKWSPQEITKRLKTDYPDCMTMRISHERIYTYIYCLPRGSLRKALIQCLR